MWKIWLPRCVELTEPDVILHLGDCQRDAEALHRQFPSLPMQSVPGNCDWGAVDAPEVLTEYGGVRILMMHGHTRNVKASTLSAVYAAREMGAQVLLFGHTHRPLVDNDGSLLVLNPDFTRWLLDDLGGLRRLPVGHEPRLRGARLPLHLRHRHHYRRQNRLLHLSDMKEETQ